MKKQLINVSDNSNFELNNKSMEILLQGVCKSFECEDFRSNSCRMKLFLNSLEEGSWRWEQTWMTPTKFFLHLIKHGEAPPEEIMQMFEEVREKWECIESDTACSCNFFEEMKKLKKTLEEIIILRNS